MFIIQEKMDFLKNGDHFKSFLEQYSIFFYGAFYFLGKSEKI